MSDATPDTPETDDLLEMEASDMEFSEVDASPPSTSLDYDEHPADEPVLPVDGDTVTLEADRKAGDFGVAQYVGSFVPASFKRTMASLKSIKATTRLIARQTPVSKVADQGMKVINQELLRRGYEPHQVKNKAFFTTTYNPIADGTEDLPVLQLVGWHGTGMFQGGERAILEFYDESKSRTKPVVSIGLLNEDNINQGKQLEVINHIMDYIKHYI